MRWILAGLLLLAATSLGLPLSARADSHEKDEARVQGEGAAQPLAWDQAKATELAGKLADSVKGLRASARRQPPTSLASGQSASRMRLIDRLRVIERESRALHEELKKGESKASTFPIFRRIDELRRSAAEDARRMFLPQETLDMIQAARAVLEELRSYYGAAPDPRADLHGPSKDD